MRIAYLTARLPYPPIGGDRARTYHFLRRLLSNHTVTLYTLGARLSNDSGVRPPGLAALIEKRFPLPTLKKAWNLAQGFFSRLPLQVHLYHSSELQEVLAADVAGGDIDLILVHLVRMAEYVRGLRAVPRVLDMVDSIYLHYSRMPFLPFSPRWLATRLERTRLAQYEAEVVSWFDKIFLTSELDLCRVREISGRSDLGILQHGVELEDYPFSCGPFEPNRIIFAGKLEYPPNADAVIYFAREVFPLVRQAVPEARFVIVGWNPPAGVRRLARLPSISLLPNVSDTLQEVVKSAVSVAPLRFGSGIQVKVIDALALGIPVVTTEAPAVAFGDGAKGIILVGRTPQEFAEHVVRVLKDKGYRERLRRAGRAFVESRYQWEQVLAPLDKVLDSFKGSKGGAETHPHKAPERSGLDEFAHLPRTAAKNGEER